MSDMGGHVTRGRQRVNTQAPQEPAGQLTPWRGRGWEVGGWGGEPRCPGLGRLLKVCREARGQGWGAAG